MSWLRNHIRCFVVPGLKALSESKGPLCKPTWSWMEGVTRTSISSSSIHPLKVNLRPSKKCKYTEAGLVYSAICSFFREEPHIAKKVGYSKTPEKSFKKQALDILRECDSKHFMPQSLGVTSNACSSYKVEDIIHSILKSSWKSLKEIAQGKTIILPGRDVWPWEVFARKNNYPTIYDPRISRILSGDKEVLREICKTWDVDFNKVIIFDTGFAGSIPAAISSVVGTEVKFLLLSSNNRGAKWTQLFPNHRGSRSKVLCIEYFPKYFKTGTVDKGLPVQYLSYPLDFVKSAAFTIWLWHNKSPRFIKTHTNQNNSSTKADSNMEIIMPG